MTLFWIVVALLTLAALLIIVLPLLLANREQSGIERNTLNIAVYKDQLSELERDRENDVLSAEQFEQGRQELERRLLEDVPATDNNRGATTRIVRTNNNLLAVAVAVLVPLVAVGLYWQLGSPDAMDPQSVQSDQMMSQQAINQEIERMVSGLAERLQQDPDDADGWAMLGRSYYVMKRYDEAVKAYEQAVKRNNNDPRLLADYADAVAVVSGNSLQGLPMKLINRALMLDPNNQKALWLAGTAAVERSDFKEALKYWIRLRDLVPPGSEAANIMENNIRESQARIPGFTQEMLADMGAKPVQSGQQAESKAVSGTVTIDPVVKDNYQPTDTLFIFARAKTGPRMPLAILRVKADTFPFEFVLDDSLSMSPAMSLSKFSDIEVIARISKTGKAIPQSGDLQGSIFATTGDSNLNIVIDGVIP